MNRKPRTQRAAIWMAKNVNAFISTDDDSLPIPVTKKAALAFVQEFGHLVTVYYDPKNQSAFFSQRYGDDLDVFVYEN